MLYYNLAESLDELDLISDLVGKVVVDKPVYELRESSFLYNEIRRIKVKADADILFFGPHSVIYLNYNLSKIYSLILQLLELGAELPEIRLMNDKERIQYHYCCELKEELRNLSHFFNQLKDLHAKE